MKLIKYLRRNDIKVPRFKDQKKYKNNQDTNDCLDLINNDSIYARIYSIFNKKAEHKLKNMLKTKLIQFYEEKNQTVTELTKFEIKYEVVDMKSKKNIILAVSYNNDYSKFATANSNNDIMIWDPSTPKLILKNTLKGH